MYAQFMETALSLLNNTRRLELGMSKDIIAADVKVQKTSEEKQENTISLTSSNLTRHLHLLSAN